MKRFSYIFLTFIAGLLMSVNALAGDVTVNGNARIKTLGDKFYKMYMVCTDGNEYPVYVNSDNKVCASNSTTTEAAIFHFSAADANGFYSVNQAGTENYWGFDLKNGMTTAADATKVQVFASTNVSGLYWVCLLNGVGNFANRAVLAKVSTNASLNYNTRVWNNDDTGKVSVGQTDTNGFNSEIKLVEVIPDYLYLTSLKPTATVQLSKYALNATDLSTLTATFEYSKDRKTWTAYETWGELDSNRAAGAAVSLAKGDTLFFRAKGTNGKNATLSTNSARSYYNFVFGTNDSIAAGGNTMSLYDALCTQDAMTSYGFGSLFKNAKQLVSAPLLPATKLESGCYKSMFYGTSLVQAPVLPAETLAVDCYNAMFEYCASLTQAPALPATSLPSSCYFLMFAECTSLTEVPTLNVTSVGERCMGAMFKNCTSLKVDTCANDAQCEGALLVLPKVEPEPAEWNVRMFTGCVGDAKYTAENGIKLGGHYCISPAPGIHTRTVVTTDMGTQASPYDLGDDLIYSYSTYTVDVANDGGGILKVEEGAYATGSNLTFQNNKAVRGKQFPVGGAINNTGTLTLTGTSTFIGNESGYHGGAIFIKSNTTTPALTTLDGPANFTGNKAVSSAGAVCVENGHFTINGPANFTGNTAENGLGGAMYVKESTVTLKDTTAFYNNTCVSYGGAIAITKGGIVTFEKLATFTGNTATSTTDSGGAVRSYGTLTFNEGAIFDGNDMPNNPGCGGAIANLASAPDAAKGVVSFKGTMDLKTATDTWVNAGFYSTSKGRKYVIVNWDLTGGLAQYGSIKNFERYSNLTTEMGAGSGNYEYIVKQFITVNAEQELGDYTIATGDMTGFATDETGKYNFLIVDGGADTLAITVGDAEKAYGKCKYSLTSRNDSLILTAANNGQVKIGNKEYASFAEAVADVQAGDTIRLVNDITDDNIAIVTPNDIAFVLDLNGHKYTNAQNLTASSNITITDAQSGTKGELNVKNLQLSGAESTFSSGSTIYSNGGPTVKANQTLNIIGPGTVFETYNSHTVMGNLNITNASITAGNQIVLLKTASTVLNGDNTLTANHNRDNYGVFNAGAFLVQTGTTNIVAKKYFSSTGNIIINDGATLDATSCDSLRNAGTITLKGGKILTKIGRLKNRGKLAWDITEKVATNLDWTMLITNDSALAIMPGLVQPKDTTYTLAEKASNANGQVFTLTGIDGKDDKTITVGGKKVYYGNRLYSLYLSAAANANSRFHGTEGQVRPTALDGGSLILGIEPGICWNVQQEKYYESIQQAFTEAVAGDTVALLTDVELEADLAIPANVCLDLAGFTLTNPDGIDLQWNLTAEPYAALLGLGTLTSAGTLTLNLADNTSCDDCVIATGNVAALTGTAFTLTGVSGLDDVTLTVDGGSIVYGGQSYIFTIEDNDTPTDPTDDALVLLQNYTRKLPRAGVYGTICLNRMIADTEGVEALFVPSWKDDRFIYCIEVQPEETTAAGAYIFKAQEEVDSVVFVRKAKAVYTPVEADNMLGWLAADTVVSEAFIADHDGYAMLAKNEIVTPTPGSTLLKNRALINLDGIGTAMPPKANGRRIVAFGEDGPTAIMTLEEVQILQPVKMIVNGQLIILRDGKKYNAQGIELTD